MKLFKFDADATKVDKAVSYFAVGFPALILLYVYLSVWGVIKVNPFYVEASKHGFGFHFLGFVFFLLFVASLAGIYYDMIPFRISNMGKVGLVVSTLILSVGCYVGFLSSL
jgi:hypothetical protein